MNNLREKIIKINIDAPILFKEPMSRHTSFQIGGPADIYIAPVKADELKSIISFAQEEELPVFFLGMGANILVSDSGIRGITVHLKNLTGLASLPGMKLRAFAGTDVSDLARFAAERQFTGAEFLFSMPGSVGGAVFMNARCYGSSISDILSSVTYMDIRTKKVQVLHPDENDFSYKHSPFQKNGALILSADVQLSEGDGTSINSRMTEYLGDRERKGHFRHPSAGSTFKNNRDFGEPTGKLIDRLGLRGERLGNAMISPEHANIIVNAGGATAADVRKLIESVKEKVLDVYGFHLEEEVIYAGDWGAEGT